MPLEVPWWEDGKVGSHISNCTENQGTTEYSEKVTHLELHGEHEGYTLPRIYANQPSLTRRSNGRDGDVRGE